MIVQKLSSPFVMVIFGATGDLTQRKLLPALFHLFLKKVLPEHFFIVGFSRREYAGDDFKDFLKDALKKYDTKHIFNEKAWAEFSGKIYYQSGHFDEKQGYLELIDKLAEFDAYIKACVPRYFYLATPPQNYSSILTYLHQTKLAEGCGQGSDKWTKVMIEKPFGRSLTDAQNLDKLLARVFKEEQIYRIDHYLGKETVQNILAFRYGNTMFDSIWNRQFIDHVQITIAEILGVETRGNFYEGVGALRDMAQSHLLELMASIAMKPQSATSEGVRDARAKIIKAINFIKPDDVSEKTVRGQYGAGRVEIRPRVSQTVIDYRKEPNVAPGSNTETFVALKLTLSDPRWEGVPFYLRTGKRLAKKATGISVVFKEPRLDLFATKQFHKTNILNFRIEPNEGIEMQMLAKKVGLNTEFETIPLSFTYQKERELPDAYERILLDAMRGDQMLFTRTDEVEAEWKFISKIAEGWWYQGDPHFPNYKAGTWGPEKAAELIAKDGREWLLR